MADLRFIMLGGFLGAGKTTSISRLAQAYQDRGSRVGIVTNDQATDLVDTQMLRSQGFRVGEVAGACFCCNFGELTDVISQLETDQRPDVVLAEPVGSCTDLVATVVQPLKQLYEGRFDVAPYGVILKPSHGQRILGGATSGRPVRSGFSPQAAYIFEKQLEEADFVLINRIDELRPEEADELATLLSKHYPDTPILRISARTGEGFDDLLAALDRQGTYGTRILELDYDRYAVGEAELGWVNCSAQTTAAACFSLDDLVLEITRRIGAAMVNSNREIAHVKTIGQTATAHAVANIISNATAAEISIPAHHDTNDAEIVVNARVAAAPDMIEEQVRSAISSASLALGGQVCFGRVQSFRPGRPVPTHRISALLGERR